MAVIDPADLDPLDPRPVFDKVNLPGGPWRPYRPVGFVEAVRVRGPFLVRRPDGMLVEVPQGRWVVWNKVTEDIDLVSPTDFAATYELVT